MHELPDRALPAVSFLHLVEGDGFSLSGSKCLDCGAVAIGERRVCAACTARERMQSIRLAKRGRLYNYTIVHRSFPGVKTPFVAAIVDLEGGGTLKGILLDTPAEPAALSYDMPVEIVVRDTGQRDPDGRPFVAFYFIPVPDAQHG